MGDLGGGCVEDPWLEFRKAFVVSCSGERIK